MKLHAVRQRLNLAKPEIWLVPGTHYYAWAFIAVLMSSCAPLVLLGNWQAVVARGWYGIFNLGLLSAAGIVSLVYVLSLLPALVRFDRANQTWAQVARREAMFSAWFVGSLAALGVVGIGMSKLINAFA